MTPSKHSPGKWETKPETDYVPAQVWMESALLEDDPQAMTQMEWEAEPLSTIREVIERIEKGE